MHSALHQTAHRPWSLPSRPWVMAQSWHDLLFAHWPIDAAQLRTAMQPRIPESLAIDTFEDQAWIGVVPFRMSGVRLRATPAFPGLSAFPELNVRTYVTHNEKPGVWFFSLDAANAIAVAIARAWFHLPYFTARMRCEDHDGWIDYESKRTHRGASSAILRGRYRPTGEPFEPQRGTLEHFLTDRYCLYAADTHGRVTRGEIHHAPWRLQPAEAEFRENTMIEATLHMECGAAVEDPDNGRAQPLSSRPHHPTAPSPQPTAPLLHFARRQDVVVWHPQPI